MTSSKGLVPPFATSAVNVGTEAASGVKSPRLSIENLNRRFRQIEKTIERQLTGVGALHSHISRLEGRFEKSQVDLAHAQNQLELILVNLERLGGIVTNHTEQLRLFVRESGRRGPERTTVREPKNLTLSLAGWLYVPLVYFFKGIYTLLSPVIITAQSLSLFNSAVEQRLPKNYPRPQQGDAWNRDLLSMLQDGSFDLASAPTKSKPQLC
ncbi:unnamed protein product [Phytomonas sp. Hart1]|nr:unnamed protein product [Phytomonas sp. Hart1]|eukprot:CCW68023.1 unnamed protein product [Phytomonas sp. isolate Hart1]